MKHLRKLIIKSLLGTFLTVLIVFVLITVIGGKCRRYKYKGTQEEYLSHWMEYINDDTLINNIVIPGSHNSGTYDMSYLGECQSYSVYEQLMCGTRYFDLRVNNNDGEYVIYHSIINGVEAEPIFKDLSDFIKAHPTEFLILDFQHFDNGADAKVYEFVNTYLKDYAVINNTDLDDLSFVSNLKLTSVRGKCIILFGEDSKYIAENNYIFSRNNDDCSKTGQVLDSYYVTEINSQKSKDYINTGLPYYIDKIKAKINTENNKGLFVLQGQLTDGKLIFGPWSKERTHEKNMSNYIKNLKDSSDFNLINIIMRDFVNEDKTKEIIQLNKYKNNLKEDYLNIFD